jgi:hypothetical protein
MIAQVLNRRFVLDQLESIKSQLLEDAAEGLGVELLEANKKRTLKPRAWVLDN